MFALSWNAKVIGIAIVTCGISPSAFLDGAGQRNIAAKKLPADFSCAPALHSDFVVNVKDSNFGAMGDGVTNDTSAIQKAVNAVAGTGGTVIVPMGIYLVDPVASSNAGISLRNDMTLRFEPGAVIQALSTSTSNYVVLLVAGVQNVNILGGMILGNRYNNNITDTREGGIGLKVARARNVVVQGLTSKNCWLDGFYVGEASQDVTLCNVVADGNRRQGMSVTSVDGLVVRGCTFKNTTGFIENGSFVCGCGVDLEPNTGQTVNNVQVFGCKFISNAKEGLAVGPAISNRGRAFVSNVLIDGNIVIGNGQHGGASGIGISNTNGHLVSNNQISDNIGNGIYLRNQANNIVLRGNVVTGTKAAPLPSEPGHGILLYDTVGNTITGNTVKNSAACGIRDAYPLGINTITDNIFKNNNRNICK